MKRKNMKRGAALFLSAAVIFSGGWGTIPQYVHAEEKISEQDMKEETGQPETDVETTTDITETEPVTNLPGETLQQAGEEKMKTEGEQTEPVQEESAADENQEQKKAAAANAETLAAGDVPLDEDHFPDEVFRNLVAEKLDANDNDVIETDEQAGAAIIVRGEIATLDGISYLSGLFRLSFQNCVVGEADVRECKNLKEIEFIENVRIGTLDASGWRT